MCTEICNINSNIIYQTKITLNLMQGFVNQRASMLPLSQANTKNKNKKHRKTANVTKSKFNQQIAKR